MGDKLFIGLDVGSDSVGWAATDENFHLKRLKGKTAWGARIFSAANSAEGRRAFRCNRRRLARRKERINLLNTIFDPYIKTKDPTFLLRLAYSNIQNDDESKPANARSDALLFTSKKEEKDFYKKYPTIFHLRRDLMKNDDYAFSDIRLLYLAIHHIIKYRGNFIREGNIDATKFDNDILISFNDSLKELFQTQEEDEDDGTFIGIREENFQKFIDIAKDQRNPKKKKESELAKLMESDEDSKKYIAMFCALCTGAKYDIKNLNKKDEEKYASLKIVFDSKYDENEDAYKTALNEYFVFVELAKAVYDYCDLSNVLDGSKYLSEAFVNIFEAHKCELKALKSICKTIDETNGLKEKNSIYIKLFKEKENKENYVAFINNRSECNIETFNEYVLETLKPFEEQLTNNKEWTMLKCLAENNRLLQTIAIRSTSVIPMQLHKKELEIILSNAVNRGILTEKDQEQILSIFQYKIPYYCGPLSNKSKYSNVVFKDGFNEPIRPWNYKDAIDMDATKKKFMDGLTNNCTYLKDKKVLPSCSLLYQDFDTLNKLNNLTLNGSNGKLSADEIAKVFAKVSLRAKTTMSSLKKDLCGLFGFKANELTLSGMNSEDYINCSSRSVLGEAFNLTKRTNEDYKICERIIFLKTIYTDSKKDGDEAIAKEFPNLNEKQKKAVKSLKCKGWSTISKEFLELRCVDENGEIRNSIINLLEEGKGNLMVIFNKYNFQDVIDAHNKAIFGDKSNKEIVNDMIEDMPPKMRRSTIQAVRIVEEVSKVAKQTPDVISLEVTRENNDEKAKKKKTDEAKARKKKIEQFLKGLINKGTADNKERAEEVLDELHNEKLVDDIRLNGKHLYLYFMQNGRDMYTGKPIDIEDVIKGNKYDTDHIIPQSKIKDDSLDNLVLVSKEKNQRKTDEYPLPDSCRQQELWSSLRKSGGISEKKYNSLTRKTELTDEELSAFVSSQINVVNHSNIVIRDIFKLLYPEATLIFSKAQYPSQIRKELQIPKLRDLNDTHHAVDAYLNIVCGYKLTERFGNMRYIKAIEKLKKEAKEKGEEPKDLKSFNLQRYIHRQIIDDVTNQKTELGELIDKTSRRHDFLLTYRFTYQDDRFYKQTICPKGPQKLNRVHDNMPTEKYGGFAEIAIEYNCIATKRGKKTSRYFVGIPHLYAEKMKQGKLDERELIKLVEHKDGEEVSIDLQHPYYLWEVVKRDGIKYLCSSYGEKINLLPITPIFLSRESEIKLSNLIKLNEKYPDESATKSELSKKIDRDGNHTLSFANSDFINIMNELLTISKSKSREYCPMIGDKAKEYFGNNREKFNAQNSNENLINDESLCSTNKSNLLEKTLLEKLTIIKNMFGVFTRNSRTLSNNKLFTKSRNSILQDDLTICYTSITGLYEQEKKL